MGGTAAFVTGTQRQIVFPSSEQDHTGYFKGNDELDTQALLQLRNKPALVLPRTTAEQRHGSPLTAETLQLDPVSEINCLVL